MQSFISGETYEIRNNLVVRPFSTQHVIPSQVSFNQPFCSHFLLTEALEVNSFCVLKLLNKEFGSKINGFWLSIFLSLSTVLSSFSWYFSLKLCEDFRSWHHNTFICWKHILVLCRVMYSTQSGKNWGNSMPTWMGNKLRNWRRRVLRFVIAGAQFGSKSSLILTFNELSSLDYRHYIISWGGLHRWYNTRFYAWPMQFWCIESQNSHNWGIVQSFNETGTIILSPSSLDFWELIVWLFEILRNGE